MTVREQIIEILNGIKPGDWENMDNLIEDGELDSLELFTLITQIGMVFGFEIAFEDLDPETFSTLDKITEMVEANRE